MKRRDTGRESSAGHGVTPNHVAAWFAATNRDASIWIDRQVSGVDDGLSRFTLQAPLTTACGACRAERARMWDGASCGPAAQVPRSAARISSHSRSRGSPAPRARMVPSRVTTSAWTSSPPSMARER